MRDLEIGNRVIVLSRTYGIDRGVIKTLYETLETAIVELDNGGVDKVPYRYIVNYPEIEIPNRDDKIVLTREQLEQVSKRLIDDNVSELNLLKSTLISVYNDFIEHLANALFNETVDDD